MEFTRLAITIKLLIALLFLVGCVPIDYLIHRTNPKYNSIPLPSETIFHNSLFIADMHADSLLFGRDLNSQSCLAHVDFPRLKIANMGLQVFTIVSEVQFLGCNVLFFTDGERSPMARTIQQAENLNHFVSENSSAFLLNSKGDLQVYLEKNFTLQKDQYHRRNNEKQTAVLLGVEGAQMLRVDNLEEDFNKLLNLNIKLIGLTHQFDNAFAGSSQGKEKGGLTYAGRTLLNLMVANGVVLDLAHASEQTINEVLEIRKKDKWAKPLLVSHTGLFGHVGHERNLTDEQAVEIARSDGVVGIMFWDKTTRTPGNEKLDIDSVVDAIIYLRNLLEKENIEYPYNHIGIGSDYDGFIAAPFAVDKLSILTSKLRQSGIPESDVSRIMGENVLRVISAWLR